MAPAGGLLRGPQLRSGSEGRYPAPPPRIAAPGRFFGAPWWPPPEACSGALNCGLAARAGIPAPPESPGRFFGAPWWPPPEACSGALNCGLAARAGIPPPPPRIAAPGRFFGAPWWPPPEACSGALNCGLAARAGIPAPPNPQAAFSGRLGGPRRRTAPGPSIAVWQRGPVSRPPRIAAPGRFFGAPARGLLRVPQFRIAWLSVATGTTVVRRNKYRFRILHIYAVKPITWQPSTTQTDGERQWAERVLCLIGGPRETVYSDCSDEHFKKTEGQIGQTQAFSLKRTRARTRRAFHGRDAGLHREGNSRRRLCAQFVCFCHWLSGQKLFAGLSLFTCTFQSLRRARRAHRDRRRLEPLGHGNAPREPPQQVGRAVCLSHSPSEIWPNTHSVFFSRSQRPQEKKAPSHRRRT